MKTILRRLMMACVPVAMSVFTQATQSQEPHEGQLSVNQVGYFIGATKYAIYGTDQAVSEEWHLTDHATGDVVARGMIGTGAYDEASGYFTHTIDFSDFNQAGRYWK
jgi:hypothetical protein